MPNFFTKVGVVFFVTLFLFLFPLQAEAQGTTFSLESSAVSFKINEIFMVEAFVNSPRASINTINLIISYPSEVLLIEEISFTDSVFPNIIEKDITSAGIIKLTAFTIDSYQGEKARIAVLKFRTQKAGKADLGILSSSKVHLADGTGTDVFNYKQSQKELALEVEEDEGGANGQPSPAGEASPVKTSTLPSLIDKIREPFKKTINFLKRGLEGKSEVAPKDKKKEAELFPEENVMDYTRDGRLKVKKLVNQLKTGKLSLLTILLVIVGFVIVVSIARFSIKKVKKIKRVLKKLIKMLE